MCFSGFYYIDPAVFKGVNSLLQNYSDYRTLRLVDKEMKTIRTLSYYKSRYINPNLKWNVIMSYNPKLPTRFNRCEEVIQKIIDCFSEEDKFSLLTYSVSEDNLLSHKSASLKISIEKEGIFQYNRTLKCLINKKKIKNV